MKFVLASNNKGKLREMKAVLEQLGHEVVTQSEAGFSGEVEETGATFYENALLKARAVMEATGLPAIADDSGLMVEALGGRPGVHSKRFGGGGLDDAGRNALLLKTLENEEHRAAQFVSSIVCVFPNGDVVSSEGVCRGSILRAPRGSGGFGYDPVFLVDGTGKSMAELTLEEKNAVSHRGNALRLFEKRLREYESKNGIR
ncbi:MAG: RdgB/HAM1 family non-canonical purine NTP pyrophosphatase [Clostridiales bacterium]|nr:RdgB/HAM1 family non-canonical purine NTP pyrophosphatase [Clostridiales bacterium]